MALATSAATAELLALAAATPAAAAVSPFATAAATPAAAAHRRVASAELGQLLRRLAGDRRVVGEPQPDPATLLVDLGHRDVDLIAGREHVLDRADALAWLHIGDVKQSVGALDELDEGAEGGRLDDFRVREVIPDLRLAGHRLDPLDAGLDQRAAGRVDPHGAVVVDVDLGLELLLHAADRLAALADHGPDLLGVDLDRLDRRRVHGELLARALDRARHLVQDEQAALARLLEGVGEDLEGNAADLDVHLQRRDSVGGPGDLEVHVA